MEFTITEVTRQAVDFKVDAKTFEEAVNKVKKGEFKKAYNTRQLEIEYGGSLDK